MALVLVVTQILYDGPQVHQPFPKVEVAIVVEVAADVVDHHDGEGNDLGTEDLQVPSSCLTESAQY